MKFYRRALGAAALITTVAVMSGCMRYNVDATIDQDNTVDAELIIAVSDKALEAEGETPDDVLAGMGEEETPPGVTDTKEYAEDGYTGYRYIYEDASIEDFSESALKVTREGDEFVVEGNFDMTSEEFGQDLIDNPDEEQQEMLDDFDVNVSLKFPGKVTESNGDARGNTVKWTAEVGEENKMTARASAIPTPFFATVPGIALIVGAVVLIGVAVAVVIAMSRKRGKTTPQGSTIDPENPYNGND